MKTTEEIIGGHISKKRLGLEGQGKSGGGGRLMLQEKMTGPDGEEGAEGKLYGENTKNWVAI